MPCKIDRTENGLPWHAGAATVAGMALEIVAVDPLDPSQEKLFAAWCAVVEAAAYAEYGDRHTSWSANEIRAAYQDQSDERRHARAALLDGAVAGHLEVRLPQHDNMHRVELTLAVHPDHRRQGIGTKLLDLAERIARDAGRTTVCAEWDVAAGHADPAEGFAARRGYVAAQTELHNELDLPVGDGTLPAAHAEADAHSAGYHVETSWDGIPDEWLADRAWLSRRMSTDAPLGQLDYHEEEWDEARVRRAFALAREQGRHVVESVARHEATGRLVAFTTIAIAEHTPDVAYQWDTLVLREHRGHRLGLLLKTANLQAVTATLPDVRRVVTWNAGDNEPMLRVNRLLGFKAIGGVTEWEKRLS
jgi:GNAT superfamily N-acetyltransferase